MKKLNLYIFKQISVSFLLSIVSLLAIIWLTQSLRFLDFITDKGIGVLTFIEITSLLMPRIFSVISPIVVFAAVLFVYNKLISDRELVVIKAAGISPTDMIKPAFAFGLLLMVFNIFIYHYGIAFSEKKFNELQWQIKNNISGIVLKSGEFNFLQNGLTVFVATQNRDGSVEGIVINDEKKADVKKTIFAQFGRIVYNDLKPRIILINGISQEISRKKEGMSATKFSRYSVDLGMSENSSNKKENGARTKSFSELWGAFSDDSLSLSQRSVMFAEANKRLLAPIYNVLFALIASIALVFGGFNRRGQEKVLAASSVTMIIIQALDIIIFSKASDNILYVPLMYFNLILPVCLSVAFLYFYKPKKIKKAPSFLVVLFALFAFNANANDMAASNIDFSADEVEYYNELGTVVAIGNVEVVKDNMSVYADKINYNQKTDEITATGNVILIEESGNVVFSEYAELSSKLTRADMQRVLVIMQDKTRLSANKAEKLENNKKVLSYATYSPCDVCQTKDPLWQLKATKVIHDEVKKDISYKNARLEVKGVPVMYMPYFSHPDPSVKRRSGFMAPGLVSNNYLGASVNIPYFWALNDHEDILLSPTFSSDKGIVYGGEYKKYLYNGYLNMKGSFLRDEDLNEDRGALEADFRYEIDDTWVFSSDINYVSDRTYLKDLSLPNDDDPWLTSELKLEGFNNRNYSSIAAYYYKTLSYQLRNTNQPFVAPLFDYQVYGDVGDFGAYSKTEFNAASVNRDEGDASTQRLSMINSWILPYVSKYGEKYKLQASLKSDLYYVSNYINSYNEDYSGTVARVFPQIGMQWSMPFIKYGENRSHVIEPVLLGVFAPDGGQDASKIPNEDSQDIRLDDTNILSLDRYAGYDRNDLGSRVSYGLNWNSYSLNNFNTSMFLAQSYNFSSQNDFAPADEEGYFSDYVGRIYVEPSDYYDLDYRFRLDKDSLEVTYSELGTSFGPSMFHVYASYIFLRDDVNTSNALFGYDEREELYASISTKLSRDWRLMLYNRLDLSGSSSQSLEHGGQLIYDNECIEIGGYVRRENSSDPELENDFEFGVNFLLKTLGGVGTQ